MIRWPLKILLCLAGLLLYACGESASDDPGDSIPDSLSNDSIVPKDTSLSSTEVIYSRDSFLLDSFLVLVDSFFTAYVDAHVAINCSIDTITERDTSFFSRKYIIMPVNGSICYWYKIDAGSSNPTMEFQFAEVRYPDEKSTDQGWNEFIRLSGGPPNERGDDKFPCITYGGDWVIRSGTKIFWLTTGCHWMDKHHRILAGLLRRSIHQYQSEGELQCYCGDFREDQP
jgi:hypothetical protein